MSESTSPNLLYINKGKFGSIEYVEGSSFAFKTILTDSELHREQLWKEFWIGVDVHHAFQSASMIFSTPRYTMYGTTESLKDVLDRTVLVGDLPRDIQTICRSQPRTTVTFELLPFLSYQFSRAYAMINPDHPVSPVRLIRLYLGRVPGATIAAVQNSSETDHPVDVQQYRQLKDALDGQVILPSPEEVSRNMGIMLGWLHWAVGVNGRDCEICLAGDGKGGAKFVIFDYNMCERWLVRRPLASKELDRNNATTGGYSQNDLCAGGIRLARLIANCESYYPRPRQADVYPSFKMGYMEGINEALLRHAPAVGATEGDKSRYGDLSVGVREGVDAFFTEYEEVDRRKVERWTAQARHRGV